MQSNGTIVLGSSVFSHNEANIMGGAIYLDGRTIQLLNMPNRTSAIFKQNTAAESGGGIYSRGANITTGELTLHFTGNIAGLSGGGLSVGSFIWGKRILSISANFSNNTAGSCGGGAYVGARMNVQFRDTTAVLNSGSAVYQQRLTLTFLDEQTSAVTLED